MAEETEENKINLDLDFESIVPWNGQQDTGKDVRLKLDRNWRKVVDAFNTLLGYMVTADYQDKKYLRKDQPDTAAGLITFLKGLFSQDDVIIGTDGYAEGMTGFGTKFGKDGSGEMSRLTLRHELRVPSLVFNQTEVNVGDKWRAPGGGCIERVMPDVDAQGNILNTGTFWLKLEKGQIGAVFTNAICMGIFHDWENTDNNATEDSDDSRGNRTYAGFTTSYFTITEISDYTDEEGVTYHRKQCRYQIRPVSDRWSGQAHPYEQMNFVCYGIFSTDKEQLKKYGTSVYETRTYRRMLWNQNTWEIASSNIAYQDGDLSNLNIHGMTMDGYSAYLNSVYFTGTVKQVKPDGTPILVAHDRGQWTPGTIYDYYDRVSHNGCLWLCVNESGTGTEPIEGDPSWLLQVKSGTSVTAAGHWESSKVPYKVNSIVTFADKVWIANKDTSEPPFGIYTDKDINRLIYKDNGYVLVDTLIQSDDWDLLLDAPQLTDGKDGASVQVRYSSDKTNWHDTFKEGDIWMQQRVDDDSLWSDAIRIVGEAGAAGLNGTYYDYQFAVNDSLTIAPATGWQDTPPSVGIGQYLWMRSRFVDPNSSEVNPWSVVRIGGEKGRGVETVVEYYQVSESNTVAPTTWVKEMPTLTPTLKYLWNYEDVVYTDTEKASTTPIVIGMYSKDGNGIKSVTEYYGLTDDADTQPTSWDTEILKPTQELRFLWNKVVTLYTEGEETTVIRIIAVYGEKGDGLTTLGAWKTGMAVPYLGIVTMGGKTFVAKVATNNPPIWVYTDNAGNRLIYKDKGYILEGTENTEEYDLLIQNGLDGRDGKSHEFIYIHTKENKRPSTPASVQTDDYIPDGWHDDPIGVSETLPYEWACVRIKKEGIWGNFSTPAIWAKWGFDSIVADLDNEMDNVALGSDGKTTSRTTIGITASMYYGSTKQALTAIQVGSVQGITSSYVLSSGVITLVVSKGVTLNERTEVPITLTASINGKTETRTLKFTLAAVKGGADGKDAVLYDIVTSVSSIGKRKDGSYTVSGVSAVRMKTIGDVSTETTDGKLKYSIDGGAETEISNNQTISSDKIGSKIQFFLYNAEGVVVDKESVPMVVDGTDGEDGKDGKDGVGINSITTTYGKSTSASIMPTSWSGAMPSVGEGEYLWTRMVTDYTDPNKEDTVSYTYTFQGKSGQAGTSISVKSIEYQAGTSATVAPTGTWSKEVVSVPQGHYLWTKTTFSDNTIAYGVAKQGADGKDGASIKSVTVTYGKSKSLSSMPTSWDSAMPNVGEGEYLWTRTITDYTDDSIKDTVTYTYSYQGKTGMSGTSVGVVSITYQAGISPTTPPTGEWSEDIVDIPQGQYLWTKTVFSDGTVAYGVAKQGTDGKDGEGFSMEGNWKTDLAVPKMGVVTMGGNCFAAKIATTNPPMWCWTDKDGNRLIFSATEYILTGELNTSEYEQWSVRGEDGHDGQDGHDGKDGVATFKSTVFIRQTSQPSTPSGGSFSSPVPSGWSDGIPSGELTLWASTRIFTEDGSSPQQSAWTTPRKMTDTSSFEVIYHSSETEPVPPTNYPSTSGDWTPDNGWTDNPSTDSVWMATATKNNGVWGKWIVTKVKGETGKEGKQGCIIRDSEWVLGTQYRNDENLTSGTRYVDVVLVRNDSATTGWDVYKCRLTHVSSAATAPGNTTYWEEFATNVSSIFTSLIIAKNAKIRFLQGNQLLMQEDDGTVTAGLSGSNEGNATRIWAGSPTPDNAPFRVSKKGKAWMEDAYVKGEIHATSGQFTNVAISGSLRTPWKSLTYKLLYYSSGSLEVWGFDGSAVDDDRIIVYGMPGAELQFAWGNNANGREVWVRVDSTGAIPSSVKIKVPAGYYIIDETGTEISAGNEYTMADGYLYSFIGFADGWFVNNKKILSFIEN